MPTEEEKARYEAKHYKVKEVDIEKKACKYARDLNCFVRKYKSPGNLGAPDRQFKHAECREFYIEFKRPGKEVRLSQRETIAEMTKAGMIVFQCDNLEVAKDIIMSMVMFDEPIEKHLVRN